MGSKRTLAVSNSGPPIHLAQIDRLAVFKLWRVMIPQEVQSEVKKHAPDALRGLEVKELVAEAKDAAYILVVRYQLDLGEAEAIALAKQEASILFFTDDFDARVVASKLGLEPHGSIGILLRAFREGVLSKERTLAALDDLRSKSSLFVTSKLIEQAKLAVEEFAKKGI